MILLNFIADPAFIVDEKGRFLRACMHVRVSRAAYRGHVPLEEMAEVLRSAGYTVVANG